MKNILSFTTALFDIPSLATSLYEQREIIRVLTRRDFLARYRGSFAGIAWSIVQPLLMMVVYTLVFSVFLKVRFNDSDSPFTFAVYLLCGLLPWNTFAEGLAQSTTLIRSNSNLVKRVVFPLEVLPVNLALNSMIQQLIGFALLLPFALIVNGKLGLSILFLPALLLIQLLLVTGINWIWAALSVFIPDLRHATAALTTVLLFITPVLYPENLVPGWAYWIVQLNPIAHLVRMTRSIIIDDVLPPITEYGWTALACLLVFILGYHWYKRTKPNFADFL